HTGETIYPEFDPTLDHIKVPTTVSNAEILKTIANIDATYKAVYSAEKSVFKKTMETLEARKTVKKCTSSVKDCDDLYNQMYTLTLALKPITIVPIVGTFMKPLHMTLEKSSSNIGATNDKFSELDKDVVAPMYKSFNQSKEAILGNESALADVLGVLTRMKKAYVNGAMAVSFGDQAAISRFASHTGSINQQLKKIQNRANGISSEFASISELNSAIQKHKNVVDKVHNGLRKISGSLSDVKSISKKVHGVMTKKFGYGPVSTSLEEVLAKEIPIPDFVKDGINDAMSSITGKLGIKFPSVPGVKEFQQAMAELKAKTKATGESQNRLRMHMVEMRNTTAGLRMPFLNSMAGIPYEHMKTARLNEFSVK
ncbi:MAG TPA: hypothetical protein VJ946_06645, partial [Bacteroidales bacterium]|nr:hypothetical protein [Bacteroidales bacterium]